MYCIVAMVLGGYEFLSDVVHTKLLITRKPSSRSLFDTDHHYKRRSEIEFVGLQTTAEDRVLGRRKVSSHEIRSRNEPCSFHL